MLIDAANGVELKLKLFEVCALRKTPIITFVNKLDREGRDPFELMEEIETVLGIRVSPVTWPIGMGDRFRGVYHRLNNQLLIYDKDAERSRPVPLKGLELDAPEVVEELGEELAETLKMEIELLDGAGDELSIERYLNGELAPVFFGSALNNFGVEPLLDALVDMAPPPLARVAQEK